MGKEFSVVDYYKVTKKNLTRIAEDIDAMVLALPGKGQDEDASTSEKAVTKALAGMAESVTRYLDVLRAKGVLFYDEAE